MLRYYFALISDGQKMLEFFMFLSAKKILNRAIKSEILLVCLVLFLLLLLRFYPLFLGRSPIFGDNYSLMVPGKIYTAHWLRQGVLPFWNPTILGGIPWLADNNQSVLYFSTLLFVVFPPVVALNLNLILHIILTFWGMWFLTKKLLRNGWAALLAAVLWAFSTQITGSMNNFSTLQTLAWLPWVVWGGLVLVEKPVEKPAAKKTQNSSGQFKNWLGRPLLLSMLITAQFLAGYPQHMIFSVMAAVVASLIYVGRREKLWSWLWLWSLTALFTLLMSSFALLPFVDAFLNSTRMEQSSSQAMVGSLHPAMLIKTFLPYFFDKPAAGIKWGPAWSGQPNVGIYLTWLGLLVGGWWFSAFQTFRERAGFMSKITPFIKQKSWRDWLVVGVVVLTLLFSLGERLPFYGLIQGIIPLFRVGRYPSMVMIVTNLLAVLLVAKAWRTLVISKESLRLFKWQKVGLVVLLLTCTIFWLVIQKFFPEIWQLADKILAGRLSFSSFHTLERDWLIAKMILDNLLVAGGFFVVGVWLLQKKSWLLLTILLGAEMIYSTQGLLIFGPNSLYDTPKFPAAFAKFINPQYRWLTRNSNRQYTDYGTHWEAMVVRAPFSDSYVDAAELAGGANLARLRDGLTPDWNMAMEVAVGEVGSLDIGANGGAKTSIGLPMIHGYTTLLPSDFAKLWSETEAEKRIELAKANDFVSDDAAIAKNDPDDVIAGSKNNSAPQTRINFIDQVRLSDPLLAEWSVKYYLVDRAFAVREDLTDLKLLAKEGTWELYELPGAKPRFRFKSKSEGAENKNGIKSTSLEISKLVETPNKIELVFENPDGFSELVAADRYDKNWQAWVNGKLVELQNCEGKRCLPVDQGENWVTLKYAN